MSLFLLETILLFLSFSLVVQPTMGFTAVPLSTYVSIVQQQQQQRHHQQQQQQQQQSHARLFMSSSSSSSSSSRDTATTATATTTSNNVNVNSHHNNRILFTQVISDVDDTLKSSGGIQVAGVALGGIDIQYERGELYPGVVPFMLHLSMQCTPSSNGDYTTTTTTTTTMTTNTPPKVAILTARAEEFKMALELKDTSSLVQAFRQVGNDWGIPNWGVGPVLYGSVAEWIVQFNKGLRKFNNFELLLQQDPQGEYLQYIYVGDTGEWDQEAGETMLREYPHHVRAVFLHVVSDRPHPTVPPPKLINGRPVLFFRTYVGAAAQAAQLHLMTPRGLLHVMETAQEQLKDVSRTSEKWTDLQRDLDLAHKTLAQTMSGH